MWSIEDVDRWGLFLVLMLCGGNNLAWSKSFERLLVYLRCALIGVPVTGAYRGTAKMLPYVYVASYNWKYTSSSTWGKASIQAVEDIYVDATGI